MDADAATVKTARITILSRSVGLVRQVSEALEPIEGNGIHLKITMLEFSEMQLFDRSSFVTIVDLESWKPSDQAVLDDLFRVGYRGYVIVLTNRIKPEQLGAVKSDRLVFVNRTSGRAGGQDKAELERLVRKFLGDFLILGRKYVRHPTNQLAQIRIPGHSDMLTVRVKNLSEGGASLEADAPLLLLKGDEVSVRIRIPNLDKIHTLSARVAWVRKTSVGVQFITKKKVA